MLISVVIPVYNGVRTIGPLVERLHAALGERTLQIVLVGDGARTRATPSFPEG